ncbi:MAG: hypothetical protein Kow0092_29160 [Deferrisomatales bacterium]
MDLPHRQRGGRDPLLVSHRHPGRGARRGQQRRGTYFALADEGDRARLLDTISAAAGPGGAPGPAQASATLSPDGRLYLPLRTRWVVGNGDGASPTYEVEELFCAFDLTAEPAARLPAPAGVFAVAGNGAVTLGWVPVEDPAGAFRHYAVYRADAPFASVEGMAPIATVAAREAAGYVDASATNGVPYYYAVTTVTEGGAETQTVASTGPRIPRDETDLQVVSLARTPRFPRYAPVYTYYELTEPSGFGPYLFSAATGLGEGQTPDTPRWPEPGDPVTYTATVRNRGTNPWDASLPGTWLVDGQVVLRTEGPRRLEPGETAAFALPRLWDGLSHEVRFRLEVDDGRPGNDELGVESFSVPFLSYVDLSYLEDFRDGDSPRYPEAATDDFLDWLNRHAARFNELFARAGSPKRIHFDVLEVLPDRAVDPPIDRSPFGIFPFRYRAGEGSLRRSGYYRPGDDIDYGLLHEMGHQLGLIDLYQLDVPAEGNGVSGTAYRAPDGLMRNVADFLSAPSALAMTHWARQAHGYYGQYLYNLPGEIRVRLLGRDGAPLAGAELALYQLCERPGAGKGIADQVKARGTADARGEWALPNVAVDPSLVPPVATGDRLRDNPFGYLAVTGTNGVLLLRVEHQGEAAFAWLDVAEANVAYFTGHTDRAVFERPLALGGPIQERPPPDLAEGNARDWQAWAEGSEGGTFAADGPDRKVAGAASLKLLTDGGFDVLARYPATFRARWDLSGFERPTLSVYAHNPNLGFQSGSPWIRLVDLTGAYYEYRFYQDGAPFDLLDEARGRWRTCQIPLRPAAEGGDGWRRTAYGAPAPGRAAAVEIRADTWGAGFTLWLDGVGFAPGCPFDGDGTDLAGTAARLGAAPDPGALLAGTAAELGRTTCP